MWRTNHRRKKAYQHWLFDITHVRDHYAHARTHTHTHTDSVWKLVLGAARETLVFQSGRSKYHHLPPLYKEFNSLPLLKTFSIQIVLSVYPALLVSSSLHHPDDDDEEDDSSTGLSITWCRRQEIMPGQSLKDTSAAGRFHLWRCSLLSVYSELFKGLVWRGSFCCLYTLLFF